MRKSAAEIINDLEMRVARLEKQSSWTLSVDDLIKSITKHLSKAYGSYIPERDVENEMNDFIELVTDEDWTETYGVRLDQKIKDRTSISGQASIEVNCTFIGEYGEVPTTIDIWVSGGGVSMQEAP